MATLTSTGKESAPTLELAKSFLDQVQLVVRMASPGDGLGMPHDSIVVSMYMRTVRLFDGVCVLIRENLPEEALVLGRSLFEDSLRLAEIANSGEGRAALLLRWAHDSVNQRKGLSEDAKSVGLVPCWGDSAEIVALRKQLNAYQAALGIKKTRPFLQVKHAAMQFGRSTDFFTYSLAHEMVHGSDTATLLLSVETEKGFGLNARTNNPYVVFAVANFCVRSALQAAKATAVVFERNHSSIDVLLQESKNLEERFVTTLRSDPELARVSAWHA